MNEIAFHLRTLTACFMHGYQQKERAELRASAFDGAARYWFRSVAASHLHEVPCKGGCGLCLRCVEGAFFGDTAHGANLVVALDADGSQRTSEEKSPLLPQHDGPRKSAGQGHPSPSPCLPPGREFTLRLWTRRRHDDARTLRVAAASTWLALALGGVGQRCRRGAGSLQLLGLSGSDQQLPELDEPESCRELAKRIEAGLGTAICSIRSALPDGVALGSHAKRTPVLSRIQVAPLRNARDEKAARSELMLSLRSYKNAAFGLPYMKTATGDAQVGGRHASPLWIRLVKTREGWAMLQTLVDSRQTIEDRARSSASWSQLERYLDEFQDRIEIALP